MPNYNSSLKAWVDRRAQPPWSPWLTLADLAGGGVPDNDPNSQFQAISEPSPGVIRITTRTNGVLTDGYQEGVRWNISKSGAWSLQAQHFRADGRQSILAYVKEVTPPSLVDGLTVGLGVLRSTLPTTMGCGTAIAYDTTGKRLVGHSPTTTAFGSIAPTIAICVGTFLFCQGDMDSGLNFTNYQSGYDAAGATVSAGNPNGTSALSGTSDPTDLQFFLYTVYRNAAALSNTVDVQLRWGYSHVRPLLTP